MGSLQPTGTRSTTKIQSPESATACSSKATNTVDNPSRISPNRTANKNDAESIRPDEQSRQSNLHKSPLNSGEHPTCATPDSSRCLDQTSEEDDSSEYEDIFYSTLEYSDAEELIFDYKSMEKLGSGGFGSCYKTIRIPDGIDIAVKISTIDDEYSENAWNVFYTELEFYERMHQLNKDFRWLPKYYGSGTLQGRPWIAMELLKMSVHQSNKLECMHPHLFKICALGALRALEALHSTGHIHRDIKPENLALRHVSDPTHHCNGEAAPTLEVVLIDFGLVRPFTLHNEDDATECDDFEEFWGTIEYASERQLREKRLGPADDLESLCYTLLELWLGRQWWSTSTSTTKKKSTQPQKPNRPSRPPSNVRYCRARDGLKPENLKRKRPCISSSCSSQRSSKPKVDPPPRNSNNDSCIRINLAHHSDKTISNVHGSHVQSLISRSHVWNDLVVRGKETSVAPQNVVQLCDS